MNYLSYLFVGVLITSLSGSVFYALSKIAIRSAGEKSSHFAYYLLKLNCIPFLIPYTFFIILLTYTGSTVYGSSKFRYYIEFHDNMLSIFAACSLIWALIVIGIIISRGAQIKKVRWILKRATLVEDEMTLQVYNETLIKHGIKRDIPLYKSSDVQSPQIANAFLHKIIIADITYKPDELSVILTHELLHLKNRDTEIKFWAAIASLIHCFNPLIYLLILDINKWSEFHCDTDACDEDKGGISSKKYFDVIINQMVYWQEKKRVAFNSACLCEDGTKIERRIDNMKSYKKYNKYSKLTALLLGLAFFLITSTISYAAGTKLADTYTEVTRQTEVLIEEDPDAPGETIFNKEEMGLIPEATLREDGLVEYYLSPEQVMQLDLFEHTTIIEGNDLPATFGYNTFTYTLPVNTRYYATNVTLSKGAYLSVSALINPEPNTYWLGIRQPDGSIRYIPATYSTAQTFDIQQSGTHNMMVHNKGSVAMKVVGTYSY